MAANVFVTVIIPTYHDWGRLDLCIKALAVQSYSEKLFEVIIVNNDPNDKQAEFNLPDNFTIITEAKPGSYAARNAALDIAKGQVIAFTDSDCIPDPKWIENSVHRLEAGEQRVAGRVELFFKSKKLTLVEMYESVFAFDQIGSVKSGSSVTANMITWRKHFDSVGFFNNSLMSGGDNEWGWRARDLGIDICYDPDVIVRHPARADFSEMLQKLRRVAGGTVSMKRMKKQQSIFRLLCTGFLPPMKKIIKVLKKKEMTFIERSLVIAIVYYFKIYLTSYKILLKVGFKKIERL